MPKPIALLYIPIDIGYGKEMNYTDCIRIQDRFSEVYPDYYWLVLIDIKLERIELKVFYEKDFDEIKFNELKRLVEDAVNEYKS